MLGNWTGGEPVRVHFGAPLELAPYLTKKDHVRTYKEIADFVMSKIAELGDEDRAMYAAPERHDRNKKKKIAPATYHESS